MKKNEAEIGGRKVVVQSCGMDGDILRANVGIAQHDNSARYINVAVTKSGMAVSAPRGPVERGIMTPDELCRFATDNEDDIVWFIQSLL